MVPGHFLDLTGTIPSFRHLTGKMSLKLLMGEQSLGGIPASGILGTAGNYGAGGFVNSAVKPSE